jgi:hypothetical protein
MRARAYGTRRAAVYSPAMANPTNAAISHLYSGRATGYVTRVAPGTRNFVPKFQRPAPRRRKPPSALWQGITAVMAFVVCVSLSVFGTYEFLARRSVMEAQAATTQSQIYIGSVLFFPETGNTCHQLYFNNRDGEFADNGRVDCTRAVSESTKDAPKSWSVARTEVISKGFR